MINTPLLSSFYLRTVLDVVTLLEAQVTQVRGGWSLRWLPVDAEGQVGEVIREIACK
jgi:hypothetical protein